MFVRRQSPLTDLLPRLSDSSVLALVEYARELADEDARRPVRRTVRREVPVVEAQA